MLAIISPAKSLDFETKMLAKNHSQPQFTKEAKQLVAALKKLNPSELASLMNVSTKLADLNFSRFKHWNLPFTLENARQAVMAFKGDVYIGLDAPTLSEKELDVAQKKIRILSGLYGILKPLDLIQAYRLEMGTKLETSKGKNLYDFWGDKITKTISKEIIENKHETLVNLASKEYSKAIDFRKLKIRVIDIDFREFKEGKYKFVSFFAKKARGLMSRFIVKNNIADADELKLFDYENYHYNDQLSTEDKWVFSR